MGCSHTSSVRAGFVTRIYLSFVKEKWVSLLHLVYFAKTQINHSYSIFLQKPHILFISRAFQKDHLSYLSNPSHSLRVEAEAAAGAGAEAEASPYCG